MGLLQETVCGGDEGATDTGRVEGVIVGRIGLVEGLLVGLNVGSSVSTVGS